MRPSTGVVGRPPGMVLAGRCVQQGGTCPFQAALAPGAPAAALSAAVLLAQSAPGGAAPMGAPPAQWGQRDSVRRPRRKGGRTTQEAEKLAFGTARA